MAAHHTLARVWFGVSATALLLWPAGASAASPAGGCPPGHERVVRAWLSAATPEAAGIKERVRAEIVNVWSHAGVHLHWLDPIGDASDTSALRIVIQDTEAKTADARRTPVLAWIMFAGGKPGTIIRASTHAAHSVLERSVEARATRGSAVHVEAFRQLVARAIGWAIAHEIGHHLSGSAQHDTVGLMRPHFEGREFQHPDTGSTVLSAVSIRRLQARLDTCMRSAP
jgi:hypothetical protein